LANLPFYAKKSPLMTGGLFRNNFSDNQQTSNRQHAGCSFAYITQQPQYTETVQIIVLPAQQIEKW